MLATNLFLLWYGIRRCSGPGIRASPNFPTVSVGVSYLPVPIVGFITILFIIERILKPDWFPAPHEPDDLMASTISTE